MTDGNGWKWAKLKDQTVETDLYILCRRGERSGYDEAFGFVVRASSPKFARELAGRQAGDEGSSFWMDPKRSTCRRLTPGGISGVLLRDFNAG